MFLNNPLSTVAYFVLMAAIVSLWVTPRRSSVWISLAIAASLTAFVAGRVTVTGIAAVGVLAFLSFAFYRLKLIAPLKLVLGLFIFIVSLALHTHRIPGFKNWLVLPNLTLSRDSFPVHLYLNFDKPLIGLFLVGFGMTRVRGLREWKNLFKETLPIILYASFALLGLSAAIGYVRLDLKWFEFSWLWLLVNLFFSCVAEEALFRGFLQFQLSKLMRPWRFGAVVSWITASILFGLIHLPGGWSYVCLATVAGLFYGYAFFKTKKVEASIFVHFAVNAIHFLAFTYPALK